MRQRWRFDFKGPDIRQAAEQWRALKSRLVKEVTLAIEAELVAESPIATGELMGAWDVSFFEVQGEPVGMVFNPIHTSSGISIVHLLERGTGIFGPFKTPIVPVKAQFLRFEMGGQIFFRRSVRGIDPKKHAFVERGLEQAMPEIEEIFRRELKGWYVQPSLF